jgi:hypothetical protein
VLPADLAGEVADLPDPLLGLRLQPRQSFVALLPARGQTVKGQL